MKKTTRILSVILAAIMLMSVFATGAFAAKFTDVKGDEYYAESAEALADLGILNGYSDGSFGALKNITRAEMATIICRMLGQKNVATANTKFTDVTKSHWASGYVNYAALNGIVGGDGNGKFRPGDNVKFEEAVKMVVCAIKFDKCLMPSPLDWSAHYLEIARVNGILSSLKGSKEAFATRGDVAVMVYNAIKAEKSGLYTVPDILKREKSVGKVNFKTFSGSVTKEGETDSYSFTAPNDGIYRFELSGMLADARVTLTVLGELGDRISHATSICNNGLTAVLNAGWKYTIQVKQVRNTCDYTLTVGQQKATLDVTNYNVITDSTEFTDQTNVYTFTPAQDGTYRFDISGMLADARVGMAVYDELGQRIVSNTSFRNDGITAPSLHKGTKYTVKITQRNNNTDYTLSIGLQKTPFDMTGYSCIFDSTEYVDQTNVYTFTPTLDGVYRFDLSEMLADARATISVYDDLGGRLARNVSIRNDGLTLSNLQAGKTYTVKVTQSASVSHYKMSIGYQTPTEDISTASSFSRTIGFTDQCDVYTFTANGTAKKVFKVSGLSNGSRVDLYLLNDLGERIKRTVSAPNGGYLEFTPTDGAVYTFRVIQSAGFSSYVINVE